ncbi:MAG: tryptophan synthase subunit alpha, partial [Elusimicrobia bacterium]|nr:tryptophan synthase subunit alpha [Elusimicrobiota bacterium]
KILSVFFVAGVPDLKRAGEFLLKFSSLGCDIIEVGVPYSDPLADGPTIRCAYERALKKGTTPDRIIHMIEKMRKKVDSKIVLMIYFNLINKMGQEKFLKRIKKAGVDGVIVPDLVYPYWIDFAKKCHKKHIAFIPLVSPLTPLQRIKEISQHGSGFLYYVNVEGTTGEREKLPQDTSKKLLNIRKVSKLPVLSGFGISSPQIAKNIKKYCDGIVVGSAVQRRINSGKSFDKFVKSLRKAV